MRVLFIEGPNEGQVHEVPDSAHSWALPKPSRFRRVTAYEPGFITFDHVQYDEYVTHYIIRLVHLRCARDDIQTFVGMLPDNHADPSMEFLRYSIARLNP